MKTWWIPAEMPRVEAREIRISRAIDYPDVKTWPDLRQFGRHNKSSSSSSLDPTLPREGMGGYGDFVVGEGGACSLQKSVTPPFGYFCHSNPARGRQFRFRHPAGMRVQGCALAEAQVFAGSVIYANRGRPAGFPGFSPNWFRWGFVVDDVVDEGGGGDQEDKQCKVVRRLSFSNSAGGNQGGQGCDEGADWFVAHAGPPHRAPPPRFLAFACDAPFEYLVDDARSKIYANIPHGDDGGGGGGRLLITRLKRLMVISDGAHDVELRNLKMEHTSETVLDDAFFPPGRLTEEELSRCLC